MGHAALNRLGRGLLACGVVLLLLVWGWWEALYSGVPGGLHCLLSDGAVCRAVRLRAPGSGWLAYTPVVCWVGGLLTFVGAVLAEWVPKETRAGHGPAHGRAPPFPHTAVAPSFSTSHIPLPAHFGHCNNSARCSCRPGIPTRGSAWSGEVFVLSRTPLAPHEGLLCRNDRGSVGHRRRGRHGALYPWAHTSGLQTLGACPKKSQYTSR